MINTRGSIFKTLKYRLRELTKHALLAPLEFKKIMIAVILNDLKEWSEYIPKDDPNMIVDILEDYLMDKCFILDRIPGNHSAYVNVNTPQTNSTWRLIEEDPCEEPISPELEDAVCKPWNPDPTCETKLIYFVSIDEEGNPEGNKLYLERVYGKYGQKLKTICDKMNIFIDRETGIGWYLDNTDCTWKQLNSGAITEEEILNKVKELEIYHKPATSEGIWSTIADAGNPIEFCDTEQLVNDIV